MNDQTSSSQVSSPKSVESASSSKFKTLKKKIKNKFRLSRAEDVKTIAQAVETLKRSGDLMSLPDNNSEQFKNEFKELRETLESIVNQNQVLAEAVKSVDSTCPDPFNEPEKFTVFFAQKSFASRSFSDEFEVEPVKQASLEKIDEKSVEIENALLRLQNLRMEEQRSFTVESENYETRLNQLGLLQQEIEILRKQNSEHEIQLEFFKTQTSTSENTEILKSEIAATNEKHAQEISIFNAKVNELLAQNSSKEIELKKLHETIENLNFEISKGQDNSESAEQLKYATEQLEVVKEQLDEAREQLRGRSEELESANEQLEAANGQMRAYNEQNALEGEKEVQLREISEENARLKIEFNDLKKELAETRTQLADLEKEPISTINLEKEKNDSDDSAFKYVYLSNLVLKFMQFPDQRPELSNIIITTLQTDQAHFQKAMGQK